LPDDKRDKSVGVPEEGQRIIGEGHKTEILPDDKRDKSCECTRRRGQKLIEEANTAEILPEDKHEVSDGTKDG
jgi:hypothetical protein